MLTAVLFTQQVFVDRIKDAEAWDKDAMREACHTAMDAAKSMLTADAKRFLAMAYGDLDAWLRMKIEAEVQGLKLEA